MVSSAWSPLDNVCERCAAVLGLEIFPIDLEVVFPPREKAVHRMLHTAI